MIRPRLRDLGINIGVLPTGPNNAITDVEGVLIGHKTLIYDEPSITRTGVTAVLPRPVDAWKDYACAGFFSFNGAGEMTGMHWLEESGLLTSPIILTNTFEVGTAFQALMAYGRRRGYIPTFALPVVAETWDGWLNDAGAFAIAQEHVVEALESAQTGPVAEGNVGGGTGMMCHDFKGGIGTASRLASCPCGDFTVGVLVQANHGDRTDLRVDGVPVGKVLDYTRIPNPWAVTRPHSSSIIIIVATDAPLIPTQCQRLARHATIGLARDGGMGHNGSGDLFLAFSTANHIMGDSEDPFDVCMLPHPQMNVLFDALAEAVEEAILNALCAAETMTGFRGHTAYALPQDELQSIMRGYRRL